MAHKDIFVTRDFPTTAGSKMLAGYRSPFDATVVRRLAEAGMPSRWASSTATNSPWARQRKLGLPLPRASGAGPQPLGHRRMPGGSSGGSAVAVAARLAPASHRHRHRRLDPPAGQLLRHHRHQAHLWARSRYGMVAFASSLDQAGPMARSAEDCALLLSAMCGPRPGPRLHVAGRARRRLHARNSTTVMRRSAHRCAPRVLWRRLAPDVRAAIEAH
jgi:aspartyl-tRNA(Asn)/glutamyl-tRNA(Gln) amidotransferase subunit A